MSINAISSVSLYEYYYTINSKDKNKKTSEIAEEMKKYGLTPTDNEQRNIELLEKAKKAKEDEKTDDKEKDIPYSKRPWADLMYQLGISFNSDPKDDIKDIKNKLSELVFGMTDTELINEVKDLQYYVERVYKNFMNGSLGSIRSANVIAGELNNLSVQNQVKLKQ